jgi:hypothetical protein
MIPARRLLPAVAALGLGLFGPAALARAACVPAGLGETVATPGVLVHYTTNPADPNATSAAEAQTLAGYAQAALEAEMTTLGMPRPVPDSDGRQDIYLATTAGCVTSGPAGVTVPRHSDQHVTDADIVMRPHLSAARLVVAHELFHAMQMAIYRGGRRTIVEGTAEWAARHLYPVDGGTREYDPGVPLDCGEKVCGQAPYDGWAFFEYLSERYGPSIGLRITQAWITVGDPAAPAVRVLDIALAPFGTSTTQAYRDFTRALTGDRLTHPDLESFSDELGLASGLGTGIRPRRIPTRRFTLEHLSARFVGLYATEGESRRCPPGRLRLTLRGPDGAAAYLRIKQRLITIPFVRGFGRLTVAWPLCGATDASLGLANPSTDGPARTFTVSGVLTAGARP